MTACTNCGSSETYDRREYMGEHFGFPAFETYQACVECDGEEFTDVCEECEHEDCVCYGPCEVCGDSIEDCKCSVDGKTASDWTR